VVEAEEDRLNGLAQAPVPGVPVVALTATVEHVAVTAEAGRVVHPVNVDAAAWIPRVQVLLID